MSYKTKKKQTTIIDMDNFPSSHRNVYTYSVGLLAENLISAIDRNGYAEIQRILLGNHHKIKDILTKWIGGVYCATPLEYVCKEGKEDSLSEILQNIDYEHNILFGTFIDGSVNSPFHYAAISGNIKVLDMILDLDTSDINLKNKNEQTILHLACRGGHKDMVIEILKNHTIEIDPLDSTSLTPLQLAASNGHLDIVKLLIERGANINNKSKYGITPLLSAASKGQIDVVLELIEHGANVRDFDSDHDTSLHFLRRKCNPILLEKLLENGALLGVKNKVGITPLNGLDHKTIESVLNDSIKLEAIKNDDKNIYVKDDYKLKFTDPFSTNKLNKTSTILHNFLALSSSKQHEYLVFHPLFKAFLDMKWQIIKKLYFIKLFIFLLFASVLSQYIFIDEIYKDIYFNHTTEYDVNITELFYESFMYSSSFISTIYILLWFLLIFQLIFRIFEMICRWRYNLFNISHWVEFILLIITTCYMFNILNHLDVLLLLLVWSSAFLHVSRYPSISPLFFIFCFICKNLIQFFLFSILLLIGFLLSFHYLFKNSADDIWAFNSLSSSALKLATMTLGEVSYEEFLRHNENYYIWAPLLGIFMFFICFVLFNMINGLAVTDTQQLRKKAEFATITSQCNMILSMEEQFNNYCFNKRFQFLNFINTSNIYQIYILPSSGKCLNGKQLSGKYLNTEIVDKSINLIESLSKENENNIQNLIEEFEKLKQKIIKLTENK